MKLRALRPVVVAAARNRFPLPLVVLGVTLFSRAMDPGRVYWSGSDMQSVFALVVYGALIPVLVIAMASGWLRGDDTPWSWALARPVTRARWLRATLAVDVVTIVLCVAIARWILGRLTYSWFGGWLGGTERLAGYAALLATVYASAAFAGARGSTAIGAAFHVAVCAAFTMATHAAAAFSAHHEMFTRDWRTLTEVGVRRDGFTAVSYALSQLPTVPTLWIVAVLAVIATRRAALALPARPRIQDPTGLAAIAVALAITFPWVLSSVVRWWIA